MTSSVAHGGKVEYREKRGREERDGIEGCREYTNIKKRKRKEGKKREEEEKKREVRDRNIERKGRKTEGMSETEREEE